MPDGGVGGIQQTCMEQVMPHSRRTRLCAFLAWTTCAFLSLSGGNESEISPVAPIAGGRAIGVGIEIVGRDKLRPGYC
ncbi:hypothetical protein BH10PLA2_BH10PLA2_30540 [soil metagenome]